MIALAQIMSILLFIIIVPDLMVASITVERGRISKYRSRGSVQPRKYAYCDSLNSKSTNRTRLNPEEDLLCCSECTRGRTWQFDPWCGTDNQTYPHPRELFCSAKCLQSVDVSYRGSCTLQPKMEPFVMEIFTSPCYQECRAKKNIRFKIVCGTDDRSYMSREQILCLNKCGASIDILHEGKCEDSPFKRHWHVQYQIQRGLCFERCMEENLSLYRPVCGNDNKTYMNHKHLVCTNKCYKVRKIKRKHVGSCSEGPRRKYYSRY